MSEGSEVARAYITVAAEMSGLRQQMATMRGEVHGQLEGIGKSAALGAAGAVFTAVSEGLKFLGEAYTKVKEAIWEYVEASGAAEQSSARLGLLIQNQGAKVGYAAEQFKQIAQDVKGMGTASARDVNDAMSSLMRSGMVRGDQFKQTLQTAQDLAFVMGESLPSATEQLSHALRNPEHGLMMLRRTIGGLSQEIEAEVKRMAKAGDMEGAQQLMLSELGKAVAGGGAAGRNTMQGQLALLGNAWEEFKETVGDALTPMIKAITPAIGEAVEFLRGKAEVLKEWTEPIAEGLKLAAGYVINVFKAISGTEPEAEALGKDFVIWRDVFLTVVDIAKAAWQGIKMLVEDVSQLPGFWDAVLFAINPIAGVIYETVRLVEELIGVTVDWHQVLTAVRVGIKDFGLTWQILTTGAALFISQTEDWFKDFWKGLKYGFQALWESIAAGWNALMDVLFGSSKLADIGKAMANAWDKAVADAHAHGVGIASAQTKLLEDDLRKLTDKFKAEMLRLDQEAAGKARTDTSTNTRDTDYGTKAGKPEFVGFAEMWKKIAQSASSPAEQYQKETAKNTADMKKSLEQANEALTRLVDKMGYNVAVVG